MHPTRKDDDEGSSIFNYNVSGPLAILITLPIMFMMALSWFVVCVAIGLFFTWPIILIIWLIAR